MKIPFYWIDAFTSRAFGGNPAAVCPLESWLDDATLQRLARQHNLSETAYFVRESDNHFQLRWFTPSVEVALCGHATLAAAHVLFHELNLPGERVTFASQSGTLAVSREANGRLCLDFPTRPAAPTAAPAKLAAALGRAPEFVGRSDLAWLVVYPTAGEVRALTPDHAALGHFRPGRFIVTGPGDEPGLDFVSRFFAPDAGIAEDPVTGSAHCVLTPYWAERTGKTTFHAKQVSARGGELWCALAGDRVQIAGQSVTYLRGQVEFQLG